MTLTVDTLTTWMNNFADKVETNKQYLSDLDTPIGDGDHGFNMSRGMQAVKEKLATKPADVPSALKTIAIGTYFYCRWSFWSFIWNCLFRNG